MIEAHTRAKEQKAGIYQEDLTHAETPKPEKVPTMKLYDQYKDRPVSAVVEYIRDAGCFNVLLLDSMQKLTIKVAGVNAPKVPSKARQEEGEAPEPFALEARFFVERHLLHRTVQLTITAPGEANRNGEFYGSVEMSGHSLAGQLVRNGYSKLVEWNAPPTELETLKSFQKEAAEKKLRVWKFATALEASGSKKQFSGKVKEIRDGSSIMVEDVTTGEAKFVIFSNVKVPRMTRSEVQPYAYEARELLRKKALGKKVTVTLDYERNEREYSTVFLEKTSLALMLVEAGLANVTSYDDNEKSNTYQELTIAENRARSQNKNLWNKKAPAPVYRVSDMSLRGTESEKRESKQKAKQFFGSLQRAGRVSGIVEHVFNGTRVKLSIPSENCVIAFGLEAVRTPTERDSNPKEKELAKEVFDFVYEKVYQRDVDVIIDSLDQAGNFFGSLFIGGQNLGVSLLEMGYAQTSKNAETTNYAAEYKEAEEIAKGKGIRIWTLQQAPSEDKKEEGGDKVRLFNVKVTEVVDGNWFFLQMTDSAATLDAIMDELNQETHEIVPNMNVKRGGLYAALFENTWHRVRVEKVDKNKVSVVCVDYGNAFSLNGSELRPLSSKLASAPAQAKECSLAFLQIPGVDEDYGEEAADLFYSLTSKKALFASVESIENGRSLVCLGDGNELVNVQMVEAGMAIVPSRTQATDPRKKNLLQRLREKQNDARLARSGRWEFGDFRDDDDY